MNLIDFFYFLLFIPLSPFFLFYIFKKNKIQIIKRKINPELKQDLNKKIWFNAVSVGEVKSLKSIIENFENKGFAIVLTITTISGFKIAKEIYSKNINIIYSPIDLSFVVNRYIKRINPLIYITNELEIWPNLLKILNKKNITLILINGRISDSAFKRYKLISFITKSMLKKFDKILVQSDFYKKRFGSFLKNQDKIKVCGNFKMDQALNDLKNLKRKDDILEFLKIKKISKPLLVAASSHSEDEEILLNSLNKIIKDFSIIIVPRHFNRIDSFISKSKKMGIITKVWSRSKEVNIDNEILLFDEMGFLFNIIKISDIVYMGGTLNPSIGGHSFYEPLVLKKPIISGNFYNNFNQIAEELIKAGILHIFKNKDDFIVKLNSIKDLSIKDSVFENIINKNKDAINCTIKEIEKLLQ